MHACTLFNETVLQRVRISHLYRTSHSASNTIRFAIAFGRSFTSILVTAAEDCHGAYDIVRFTCIGTPRISWRNSGVFD